MLKMAEDDKKKNNDYFFIEIVRKTKTGITFPKELRENLFEEGKDVYFKLIVPNEKDKIILEILNDEQAKKLTEKLKAERKERRIQVNETKTKTVKKKSKLVPNWHEYFVYDFKNKGKVIPILESAFYKFSEKPINLKDGMGRVKFALTSFLTSIKTENAKLYYAIEKFLIDIVYKFNQSNLLDWIFEKIIPNIESNFLYELALLDLVEASIKTKRYEKAELYIFYVLKNIDEYPKSEMYNIMNSFKQLVKKVKNLERSDKIDILIKEKLLEYGEEWEDVDYKIQIIEFLEDLQYIELAYDLAKKILKSLPPNSMRLDEVKSLVRRLHVAPIAENKPHSSIDFDELDDEVKEEK